VTASQRPQPPLYAYSPAFQTRAAAELDALSQTACDRQEPTPGCSAIRRLIADYKTDRDGLRTLGAKQQ